MSVRLVAARAHLKRQLGYRTMASMANWRIAYSLPPAWQKRPHQGSQGDAPWHLTSACSSSGGTMLPSAQVGCALQ